MIYVKFVCNTPYCNTEICYQEFEKKDKKLFDKIIKKLAKENGKIYEYLINSFIEDELESYYEDCYSNSYWEIISEEEYHNESGW